MLFKLLFWLVTARVLTVATTRVLITITARVLTIAALAILTTLPTDPVWKLLNQTLQLVELSLNGAKCYS